MFKGLRAAEAKTISHSGRSYVGETLQLEGDLKFVFLGQYIHRKGVLELVNSFKAL